MRYGIAALIFMAAPAAFAQTDSAPSPRPEPLAGVYVCVEIADDSQRLDCYDAAVGRMRQAESEGQFVAVDREQVQTMRREAFGFQLPAVSNLFGGGHDDGLDRIELQVERVIPRSDGRHVFVMSDGQRWAQIEARRANNVRAGDTVTVRRAALGSYMLAGERGGSAHRVRREN